MKDLTLTDQEAGLLSEFLKIGHRELLREIRHTDRAQVRDDLRSRLRTIDRLGERLRQFEVPVLQLEGDHHAT